MQDQIGYQNFNYSGEKKKQTILQEADRSYVGNFEFLKKYMGMKIDYCQLTAGHAIHDNLDFHIQTHILTG